MAAIGADSRGEAGQVLQVTAWERQDRFEMGRMGTDETGGDWQEEERHAGESIGWEPNGKAGTEWRMN